MRSIRRWLTTSVTDEVVVGAVREPPLRLEGGHRGCPYEKEI